jgi:hypothetical protein
LATVAKEVHEPAENNFLWVSLVFNELRHMWGFTRFKTSRIILRGCQVYMITR